MDHFNVVVSVIMNYAILFNLLQISAWAHVHANVLSLRRTPTTTSNFKIVHVQSSSNFDV